MVLLKNDWQSVAARQGQDSNHRRHWPGCLSGAARSAEAAPKRSPFAAVSILEGIADYLGSGAKVYYGRGVPDSGGHGRVYRIHHRRNADGTSRSPSGVFFERQLSKATPAFNAQRQAHQLRTVPTRARRIRMSYPADVGPSAGPATSRRHSRASTSSSFKVPEKTVVSIASTSTRSCTRLLERRVRIRR